MIKPMRIVRLSAARFSRKRSSARLNAPRFAVRDDLDLNVRMGPGANNQLIATLAPSTPVVVLDRLGDWVRIVASGAYETTRHGWVNSRFLVAQ